MQIEAFKDGFLVHAAYPNCLKAVQSLCAKYPLVLTDPPYGGLVKDYWDNEIEGQHAFANWLMSIIQSFDSLTNEHGSVYFWGGIGNAKNRPLFEVLSRIESETNFTIKNFITWSKRRAYGVQHNFSFTREDLVWLIKNGVNDDPSKPIHPSTFNVPYLDEKRTCRSFNPNYKCKSDYLRRTNVWTDITELFRGKVHSCQKPVKLYEIPILACTNPGGWVFDPFAGSGTCAEAAIKTGRKFVCVERDAEIFQIALRRIKALYAA